MGAGPVRHLLLGSLALFVMGGCATSSAEHPEASAAPLEEEAGEPTPGATAAKLICESETPTGSHIPTRRCRRADEADADRAQTEGELTQPRGTNPPKPGG